MESGQQVYLTYQLLDEFGRRKLIAISDNRILAEEIAKGKGWYDGNGVVDSPMEVFTTFEDYELDVELHIQLAALAKLSPEEKKALGLDNKFGSLKI